VGKEVLLSHNARRNPWRMQGSLLPGVHFTPVTSRVKIEEVKRLAKLLGVDFKEQKREHCGAVTHFYW